MMHAEAPHPSAATRGAQAGAAKPKWVVIYAIFVAAVILAVSSHYRLSRAQLTAEIFSDTRTVANLKASAIFKWRRERLGDAVILASDTLLTDALRKGSRAPGSSALRGALDARLEQIAKSYGYLYALLVSPAGVLLAASNEPPANLEGTIKPLVTRALAAPGAIIASFVKKPGGAIGIDTLGLLRDSRGEPLAVIILHSDARSLAPEFALDSSHRITTELAAGDDGGGASVLEIEAEANVNMLHHLGPGSAIPGLESGQYQGADWRGKPVMAFLHPINGTGWTVIAKADQKTLDEELRGELIASSGVAFLLLMFVGSAMGFAYRSQQARVLKSMFAWERDQRASLAVYRATLESISDGVITTGSNGRVATLNPAAERLTGWSGEDARGRPLNEILNILEIGTRKPVEISAGHPGAANDPGPDTYNVLISRDGGESTITLSTSSLPADGREPGRVIVFRDQSHLFLIQRSLLESEQFNVSIINSLAEQIAVLDANGVVVSVNEAWRDFASKNTFGMSDGMQAGIDVLRICRAANNEAFVNRVSAGIREVLTGRQRYYTLEFPCHWCEDRRWFRIHVSQLAGSTPGAVVAYENITAQKIYEIQLTEAHAQLEATVGAIPDILFEFDGEGHCRACRAPKADLLPAPADTLVGKHITAIFPPDAAEIIQAALAEANETGLSTDHQYELGLATGHHTFELSASRKPNAASQSPHFVVLVRDTTEKSLARRLILENEARLQSMIRSLPVPFALVGRDGRVQFLNPAFIEATGYAIHEIPFLRDWTERAFPDPVYRKWVSGQWQYPNGRAVAGRSAEPLELRVRCADGGEKTVLASATPLNEGHGEVDLFVLFDITRQKQAEVRMVELTEQLMESQRVAGLGTYVVDFAAGIWEGSSVFSEALGIPEVSARQATHSVPELIHPDDREMVALYFERKLTAQKANIDIEFRIRRPSDQSVRWLQCMGKIEYAGGQAVKMLGTVQNVTGRRQTNEKLLLQGSALNAAAFAIMITDARGIIQYVNPAFEALTGYSSEESIGKTPGGLLNSGTHDEAFYQDLWNTVLAGKLWQHEVINRRKDGTLYPDEVTITPVIDKAGKVVNFISFRRDLTLDKQREARFLQAQKMEVVGQFAAGIAHNFNNILTGIQATAVAATLGMDDEEPVRQSLREITQNVERGATLTRQLQNFRQGAGSTDPVYVDIGNITSGLTPMVRRLLTADIELRVLSTGAVPGVMMDRGQFEQVLLNLVTNARDAMPDGGKLTVTIETGAMDSETGAWRVVETKPDWVKVAVTDTGSGIDQETLGKIFEPFYSTKPPGKGTGLGLSTVYNIVTHNKGRIWATSEPGRGTTMSLLLPRFEESIGLPPPQELKEALPRGIETLLLVEDEENILRSLKKLLASSGYVVLAATCADEALELLSVYTGPVHLMLADTVMPGMSGLKLAEIVAAQRPGIAILHMSALSAEEIRQRDGNMQASNFIQKPFQIQELAWKIRRMIDETTCRTGSSSEGQA